MELVLWIFAWVVGAMSLFLVADMIASDLANSRAERIATRRSKSADKTRLWPKTRRLRFVIRRDAPLWMEAAKAAFIAIASYLTQVASARRARRPRTYSGHPVPQPILC